MTLADRHGKPQSGVVVPWFDMGEQGGSANCSGYLLQSLARTTQSPAFRF